VSLVGVYVLCFLVSARLEVNDQLHAPTDLLSFIKPRSALTSGQQTGHGYERRETPPVEGVECVCWL
jgi:hypothetical protein